MRMIDIIDRKAVVPRLKARTRDEVLMELSAVLAASNPQIDADRLFHVLLEREKMGSTGLEHGVAIPHGKLQGIATVAAAFGRSPKGVDFESMDGKPAKLFFLLAAPDDHSGEHLKALARVARAVKEESFRKKLLDAKNADSIYRVIEDMDNRL